MFLLILIMETMKKMCVLERTVNICVNVVCVGGGGIEREKKERERERRVRDKKG